MICGHFRQISSKYAPSGAFFVCTHEFKNIKASAGRMKFISLFN